MLSAFGEQVVLWAEGLWPDGELVDRASVTAVASQPRKCSHTWKKARKHVVHIFFLF